MAGNRAFKNLAALRDSFVEAQPVEEPNEAATISPDARPVRSPRIFENAPFSELGTPSISNVSSITGKVDGRRKRKVLKTPSVSLSVSVRREIHEDISAMLFAQKSTWIALLDDLLHQYVQQAKTSGQFPK